MVEEIKKASKVDLVAHKVQSASTVQVRTSQNFKDEDLDLLEKQDLSLR